MPKLPDSTALSPVAPVAAESFVNMPVADYQSAGASLGQAVSNVGTAVGAFADERRKKMAAQERFDTRMKLLDGEAAYNDRVKDLDPLDPEYVGKKQAARKEVFGPILTGVRDPENKQFFDLSTKSDYIQLGINAGNEQKAAYGKDAEIKVGTYVDHVRSQIAAGTYKGDPVADVNQAIDDNQYLGDLQKEALKIDKLKEVNTDLVGAEFNDLATKGVSLTPEAQAALNQLSIEPGVPAWMPGYLGRIAMIESRGGRNKVNGSNPSVAGTWQIATGTAKDLGMNPNDRMNDVASARATAKLTLQNYNALEGLLGRAPTPGELYLAHQQGAAGAMKLLRNPDKTAADVLGKTAVEANLPESMKGRADSITASQFASLWINRVENTSGKIDTNEAMSVIRESRSYQSLDVDSQATVEKNILARAKDYNDAYQTQAEQDVADGIIQVATIKDPYGNDVIDPKRADDAVNAIADVGTRKAAGSYVTLRLQQQEREQKAAGEAEWNSTYEQVNNALRSNNPTEAQKIIDSSKLPPDKKDSLSEKVKKGAVQKDDQPTYHALVSLYYQSPKAFVAATDNPAPYMRKLTDETLLKIKGWRDDILKADNGDKHALNLRTIVGSADGKINDKLREIGVDPNAKSGDADARYAGLIRDIAQKELEKVFGEKAKNGEPILESEINATVNDVFKMYPASKNPAWYNPAWQVGLVGPYTVNTNIADALKGAADEFQNAGKDIEAAAISLRASGQPVTADNLLKVLSILTSNDGAQQ